MGIFLFPCSTAAPNRKRSWRSRLLPNSDRLRSFSFSKRPSSTNEQQQKEDKSDSNSRVTLDLSGQYHCLLLKCSNDNDDDESINQQQQQQQPLFQPQWGSWAPPCRLFLSIHYDFATIWYGATRVGTNLQLDLLGRGRRHSQSIQQDADAPIPLVQRWIPRFMTWTTERQLPSNSRPRRDTSAIQVGFTWEPPISSMDATSPELTFRLEPTQTQWSLLAPLHRRLHLVWKSTFASTVQQNDDFDNDYSQSMSSSSAAWLWDTNLNDDDWWIPQMKINTSGKLLAQSKVGFGGQRQRQFHYYPQHQNEQQQQQRRYGVRILLSRQMGWNAFGGIMDPTDEGDRDTRIRLEVVGTGRQGESCTAVAMETVLERIVESTRWTVTREQLQR